MPLVLEITGTNLKADTVDSVQPGVLPVEFHYPADLPRLPPQYQLDDHSVTKDQRAEIVKNLLPKFQQEAKEYEKTLGHFLPLKDEASSSQLVSKLVHKIMLQYQLSDDLAFVVDHDFSEKFKIVIHDTLVGLQVKTVIFLPCSVLSTVGANVRDALVVYLTMECVKIYVVSDLREIVTKQDTRVNLLSKNHDIIQELVDEAVGESPIDLRRKLRERIVVLGDDSNEYIHTDLTPEKQKFETRQSMGCWEGAALYAQSQNIH
ncbi:hypothetical protein CANMA_003938 [Candida margitis]|uniref:uncharacterized protein n=1 Tax=Candida margitis TaxID=1775924 RepID=UPI002226E6FE|nr:uncharacterized protein CANMA_003938 [Candida margitis]KAI5961042.1 hypothetical protein CANMA_003938 [Candida margitis]